MTGKCPPCGAVGITTSLVQVGTSQSPQLKGLYQSVSTLPVHKPVGRLMVRLAVAVPRGVKGVTGAGAAGLGGIDKGLDADGVGTARQRGPHTNLEAILDVCACPMTTLESPLQNHIRACGGNHGLMRCEVTDAIGAASYISNACGEGYSDAIKGCCTSSAQIGKANGVGEGLLTLCNGEVGSIDRGVVRHNDV